jgi:abortive infection Abi-like protein
LIKKLSIFLPFFSASTTFFASALYHVRNNQSLAHNNELLDSAEARFIYDSFTAILRFVKSVEANRFDAVSPSLQAARSEDDEIPF